MKTPIRLFSLLTAVALAPLFHTLAQVATPELPPGSYEVAYYDLRGENVSAPGPFIATLGAAPGITASAAKGNARHRTWRTIPADAAADKWITLTRLQSGRQNDFFAFCFSDKEGTVSFAARRPSRERAEPPMYPYTIGPGPWQLPMNAIREPATDILYRFKEENIQPRPLLQIVAGGPAAGNLTIADGTVRASTELTEAVTFAAAWYAGWRPTAAADAPKSLHVALSEVQQITFDFTCGFADNTPGVVRRDIPREELFNHLVAIFLRLREPLIVDAMPKGASAVSALTWQDNTLALSTGNKLTLVNLTSGDKPKDVTAAAGAKASFVTKHNSTGHPRLYSFSPSIQQLNHADANFTPAAPVAVSSAADFAVSDSGDIALAGTNSLSIYSGGKSQWVWKGATGTPAWGNGKVTLLNEQGKLFLFNPTAKKLLWQIETDITNGKTTHCGETILVYNNRRVDAFDATTGKVKWQRTVTDRLLVTPVAIGDNILIAVAPGIIQTWRNTDGKTVASRNWPTWILTLRAVKAEQGWLLACVDLRNRLIQLDPQTLATKAEVTLPARLKPVLAYGNAVPNGWAPVVTDEDPEDLALSILRDIHAETTRTLPAWLTIDTNGSLYAIAIAGGK